MANQFIPWTVNVEDIRTDPPKVLTLQGHSPNCRTIRDIKKRIVKVQGEVAMKLEDIRLMKGSTELNDSSTLSDAGISDNDNTLQMKRKYHPPWNILVQDPNGKNKSHNIVITRENPEETTVRELKVKIKEKTGIELEEQRLTFRGKPLEDRFSFEDLNIVNDSTLFLVFRARGGSAIYQGMLELLRECPTRTINNIPNVPMFRACPHCGTLLEHIDGCNNFTCCRKTCCFICLSLGQNGGLNCGSNCSNVANRQTYIVGQT